MTSLGIPIRFGTAVAALAAISLHASNDRLVLGVDGRANATPSMASDGSRVAVAWGVRDPQGRADVYVAMSADAGQTFATPVRVSDEKGTARLGGELPPRVTIDGSRVAVLWTSRDEGTRVVIAKSDDGGRTFGAALPLQERGAPGDRGWQSLAVGRSGALHAAWLDHRGAAGSHHATPEKSALIYNGGTGEVEITKGVCYCCKTATATGSDGRVFVAWRHVYPDNIRDIAFSMSRDGGRTFAAPVRVSEDRWQLNGCPDDGPSMTVDSAGRVHLVWPTLVERPEPHKEVFYTWTDDGRAFAPRVRMTEVGRNAGHAQVVANASGITVVWDEVVDGQRQVFARRRSRAGDLFAPVALSDPAAPASYPVAGMVGDTLVAAWVRGGGTDSTIVLRRVPVADTARSR
jgi:hypothetical protein